MQIPEEIIIAAIAAINLIVIVATLIAYGISSMLQHRISYRLLEISNSTIMIGLAAVYVISLLLSVAVLIHIIHRSV